MKQCKRDMRDKLSSEHPIEREILYLCQSSRMGASAHGRVGANCFGESTRQRENDQMGSLLFVEGNVVPVPARFG